MSQTTLESYLQELAAESFLLQLPEAAKDRIRFLSSFFSIALSSPGWNPLLYLARTLGDGLAIDGWAAVTSTFASSF